MPTTSSPRIVRTIAELRSAMAGYRRAGERAALVPTMGALHAGHLSLVEEGFRRAQRVVVSIFVNPSQFAPSEDFSAYPRTWDADIAKLAALSTDLVFAPTAEEMYPPGFATRIEPAGAALGLESDFRPHFFGGVATVVAKLLLACLPDCALFGEKDYQQLCVVRQLARDLAIPVEIVGCPTMREADGLAMSSRNVYLDAEERRTAAALHRVLQDAARRLLVGVERNRVLGEGVERLLAEGFGKVDYLDLRREDTLEPAADGGAPARLLAAAWLGRTRLIDNLALRDVRD